MDALGLPMSFGKPAGLPPKPVQDNAAAGPSRGGQTGGRGSRGAVGQGKKNRGRGRGGASAPDSPANNDSNGLKRSHPGSSLPSQSTQFHNPRGGFPHQPRGGGRGGSRGDQGSRGGMRGGRGGGRGGHTGGDGQRGFWKDSFIEDPWKELLERRDRKRGQA